MEGATHSHAARERPRSRNRVIKFDAGGTGIGRVTTGDHHIAIGEEDTVSRRAIGAAEHAGREGPGTRSRVVNLSDIENTTAAVATRNKNLAVTQQCGGGRLAGDRQRPRGRPGAGNGIVGCRGAQPGEVAAPR